VSFAFNGGTNTEYIWYQDANKIFSFGGGGPSGSNKKLHVDGGLTIGASYDATSINSTNGLIIQGNLGVGGNNATDHDAVFNGTNAVKMPSGTTAQRPASPQTGSLRLNESTVRFEYYYPSTWYQILASSSNLTQGSVLFADVNGNPTQDNSNLFWNDTNNRLGIGTSSPTTPLHVLGGANAATMQYNAFASPLRVYNSASVGTGLRFEDSSGASDIYYNNGTYSIGGGGSAVTNKKAHIDGGTTIGANYDGTSIDANSLKVEGSVTVNTRTGTGTSLTMYDTNGKFCTATFGNGLLISGGSLLLPAGVTTGNFLRWNGTAWASDVPIFSFGVSGSTTNISCNSTANALIAGGTNMSATQSGGTVTVSSNVAFGQLHRASSQTVTITTSWQKYDFNETPITNGVTASNTTDQITVPSTGTYEIYLHGSLFQTSVVSTSQTGFRIYNNTSSSTLGQTVHTPDANKYFSVSLNKLVSLTAGDVLEMQYADPQLGGSATGSSVTNAIFYIKRIN